MIYLRLIRRKLKELGLIPTSVVGWMALYVGIVWVFVFTLRALSTSAASSAALSTAFFFSTAVECVALVVLAFRFVRHKLLWRLRNRLIVTYVFIGVIPMLLLFGLAALAGFLFAGQFSSYVVTNDMQREMERLGAVNSVAARHIAGELNQGRPIEKVKLDTIEPGAEIVAVYKGKTTTFQSPTLEGSVIPEEAPEIKSIVLDRDGLYFRAVTSIEAGPDHEKLSVMTSVPLTKERVEALVGDMGQIAFYGRTLRSGAPTIQSAPGVSAKVGEDTFILDPKPKIEAGKIPEPKNWFDWKFLPPGALLMAHDWQTGKNTSLLMTVRTRPSVLYQRLFQTLGEMTTAITFGMSFVAAVFGIVILLAVFIGWRLSNTMTRSVAELYNATQRVNRGDFSGRIRVKSKDQLAALETSFNSMTESLEKLIAEQKEKHRIEGELAIAQEVQALLFPRDITEIEGMEVHGKCKPARTVSGDYYDFLPVSGTRLGIAVGDISGKGISAALLMATVHAFVRAYTLVEKVPARAAVADHPTAVALSSRYGQIAPGALMAMLNQQMYESTPTEKYATMFLGVYDQTLRELKYSNAGHLPPLLIGTDGGVRELNAAGGTVVGLFGGMTYPDASVAMRAGDIFVAYSDGVTEPENEFGEFGIERLAQLVQENRHLSLARISDIVIASVVDWIGENEQPDDVTLVLARAR